MTKETKEVAKKDEQEQEVDAALVTEACETITKMFEKHVEKGVTEVGEYLINEFFEGDYEKARGQEKEKIKNSPKGSTLNQVIISFKRDSDNRQINPKGPSKSWLYQAINLVIQEKDLKKELSDEAFQTYGNLNFSQKVALLSLKEIDDKNKFIKKANKEALTFRALKKEIMKHKADGERVPGLLSIINKPENFFKKECQKNLSLDSLKKLGNKKLEKIPDRIKEKKEEIDKILNNLNEEIKNNKSYLEKLDDLEPTIKQAIEETKNSGRKSKSKS